MSFSGKTVFITGASGGLGTSIAEAFAASGAFVVAGYRTRSSSAEMTVKLDVTSDESVASAVAAILEKKGRIDVLVNAAGIAEDGPFALMDSAAFERVVATNLAGTFRTCKAVARAMLRNKSGAIVNMASVSGWRASPGQANYVASKGGIVALTQTLAAELGPSGIRVNAVVPGLIDAGMVHKMPHTAIEHRKSQIPLGRLGHASELAKAVLFLASDDAAYITGHALVVDGGLSV